MELPSFKIQLQVFKLFRGLISVKFARERNFSPEILTIFSRQGKEIFSFEGN